MKDRVKILVARPLDAYLVKCGLGDVVAYRPELAAASSDDLRSALWAYQPNILLPGKSQLDEETCAQWRKAAGDKPLAIVRNNDLAALGYSQWTANCNIEVLDTPPAGTSVLADIAALAQAEAYLTHNQVIPYLQAAGLGPSARPDGRALRRVLLIGAGIVNLITAWELANAGYEITFLDSAPDPRTRPDWQLLGATHGGGNARMFSLTEADNYNDKGSLVYSDMGVVLRRCISEGGWLARTHKNLTPSECQWLEQYHSLPAWLAEVFTQDIYAINRESLGMWEQMRNESPSLFEDVGYVDDILRIYTEPDVYEAAIALQSKVGALKQILRGREVAARHPAFTKACEQGEIVGGLDAVGFTLNIHDFVARLLRSLEARGTLFRWGVKVTRITMTADGAVDGLETTAGFERAGHYVFSPGAYCQESLAGTRTEGKVQGIFGLWLTLPNLNPMLRHSVKLHREGHVGEDSNITLAKDEQGRPILLLGSGYGFLGNGPFDLESPEVAVLFEALEETARRYLPDSYSSALADGSLRHTRKACIRPFTATGLGIFEVLRTTDGGRLVITTGHNTGGFTQAPSVARGVLATLDGELHPMQEKYHPERGLWT